jgi:uncharacterized protein YggU (UPF0235/DUF167 family)
VNGESETGATHLRLHVRLNPRGGRDAIESIDALVDGGTRVKARVRAAPEKGAANDALIALVAEHLDLPKSSIAVLAGATSRRKILAISGDASELSRAAETLGAKLVPEARQRPPAQRFVAARNHAPAMSRVETICPVVLGEGANDYPPVAATADALQRGREQPKTKANTLIFRPEVELLYFRGARLSPPRCRDEARVARDGAVDIKD